APTFFKSQSALVPLLLAPNRDPLRWARGWIGSSTETCGFVFLCPQIDNPYFRRFTDFSWNLRKYRETIDLTAVFG
ncbi:MAG: hypothetical protein ACI4PV_08410, partial [Butyricicoccus sp.]